MKRNNKKQVKVDNEPEIVELTIKLSIDHSKDPLDRDNFIKSFKDLGMEQAISEMLCLDEFPEVTFVDYTLMKV